MTASNTGDMIRSHIFGSNDPNGDGFHYQDTQNVDSNSIIDNNRFLEQSFGKFLTRCDLLHLIYRRINLLVDVTVFPTECDRIQDNRINN